MHPAPSAEERILAIQSRAWKLMLRVVGSLEPVRVIKETGVNPAAAMPTFPADGERHTIQPPPDLLSPLEEARVVLGEGKRLPLDLHDRLTYAEIMGLEREFDRKLQWRDSDPSAPHNRRRVARMPERW